MKNAISRLIIFYEQQKNQTKILFQSKILEINSYLSSKLSNLHQFVINCLDYYLGFNL